jgi:hypothetical protein
MKPLVLAALVASIGIVGCGREEDVSTTGEKTIQVAVANTGVEKLAYDPAKHDKVVRISPGITLDTWVNNIYQKYTNKTADEFYAANPDWEAVRNQHSPHMTFKLGYND